MRPAGLYISLLTFMSAAVLFAAGVCAHDDALPLGDGHLSADPAAGYLYACQTEFRGRGARGSGSWIQGDTWFPSAKPKVQGSVSWPGSAISISLEGDRRVIRANDLPKHATGIFPIQVSDPAYQYDHNPNSIRSQDILLTLPAMPVAAATPGCVPQGMIGFALDGVAIFNAVDAAGRDAVAHEVQDACNGHPQQEGQYHYHGPSPCMADPDGDAGRHSDLVGYALDGYGIYGMHGEDGHVLHDSDLDACHGHSHAVMWDGTLQVIYHYHLTPEYPYTVGCFHGNVDRALMQNLRPRPEGRQGPSDAADGPAGGEGMGPPAGGRPDLQRAAATLGVSVERLRAALGPPPPDLARAAADLGVSEQSLRDALHQDRDQGQSSGPP